MKRQLKKFVSTSFATTSDDNEEIIRARAFELYVERGQEHGRDLEDWFRAVEEVSAGQAHVAAA